MDDFADMNDEQVAELLLALRNPSRELRVALVDPPADVQDHVPEHREQVVVEAINRKGVLLTSIGVITAIIGAGFVFIQKLFEDSEYSIETLLQTPTWGEYLTHLTPQDKQRWCVNTAHYIDAMRNNKQLEVVIEEGHKKFKPSSDAQSGALVLTPAPSMILNGNETIQKRDVDNKMVYNNHDGEVIELPEDPIELSAFCMAHFFHKENVQTLVNWGPDFQLISEIDLLQILGDSTQESSWKKQLVGSILKNAFDVYKQTNDFNEYIMDHTSSLRNSTSGQVRQLRSQFDVFRAELPQYRDKCLLKIATEHPTLWWAGNQAVNYPVQSTLFILFLAYYMRKEIRAMRETCIEIGREGLRFLGWLCGQNPDNARVPRQLRLMDGEPRGGSKRKIKELSSTGELPTVIVINNTLSKTHINALLELFDKDGSIKSFVKYIEQNKKVSIFTRDIDKIKDFGTSLKRKTFNSKSDPKSVADIYGGKRKTKRRQSNSTKRKQQNKRKTHKR